jgi:hypothetical protein
MARKGSDLPNPTIEVAGLTFSSRLGVAAALWLEETLDCSIQEITQQLEAMQKSGTLSMTFVTKFVVALYMQANLDVDPQTALNEIRRLSLDQLMEVISRMTAGDFEPKEGDVVPLTETGERATGT